jgi:hypothetical protein
VRTERILASGNEPNQSNNSQASSNIETKQNREEKNRSGKNAD